MWRKPVGEGFAGPAIAGGRLILFHRIGAEEIVESLDAKTGDPQWRFAYPTAYRDSFGFDEGPRAVPVISGNRVYTFGAEGHLHALDLATGIGGYPRGRVVEVYGPESSGKTTLALHAIAEAQRNGGVCAFIDAEHAIDVNYARALGVDTDKLLVSQPDTGEQALDICDMLVRSGAIDLIDRTLGSLL